MENTGTSAQLFNEKVKKMIADTKWCTICHYPLDEIGRCMNCLEVEDERRQELEIQKQRDIKRLGGLRAYEDYTIEKLDSKYYSAHRALETAKSADNLYIWGPAGVGKSHLAVILTRAKYYGLVIKPQDMMRILKEKILDARKEQADLDFLINHNLLCIDDMGAEKLTSHTKSLLYEVMDGRYANKKKGLIITSNLSLSELSAQLEDDRISSRIAGMCQIIRMVGEDRRIVK